MVPFFVGNTVVWTELHISHCAQIVGYNLPLFQEPAHVQLKEKWRENRRKQERRDRKSK